MARNGKPNWPFVEVIWVDSVSDSKWRALGSLPELATIQSRGWLIIRDKKKVTIAATRGGYTDGTEAVGEVTTIPRGCIRSIKELKV